ncbi:putative metalloenzyme, LuxS/M16 peptidase [Helianthus annuus]|uniref:Metalloenzyme, LuxS/M16 peptidase n=1 Tax=Helianthus annuus TaxID=4232 RepID=A0A9K3HWL5_HELAN|nr:putative metalloenzyme, LuxS/M16 peptidase [Helianthus annuus]KAJ0883245.1 putative metalloenzyme, LuxS/M16 peptidase [Helianthus annuus]
MAVGKDTAEEVAVEMIKPRNDTRNYKRIILPNSLQVLLISDPDTDKAYLRFKYSITPP